MTKATPVTLVILTLAEIDGVGDVFPTLPLGSVHEVLVVDGGSTDGTLETPRIGRGVSRLNVLPVGLRFLALLLREWPRPRVPA